MNFGQKTKYYISRRIDLPEDNLLHKWYMVFTQEQSEILSTSKTFLTILSGLSIVFLLLFSIGIYLLCRLIIVKPVRQAIVALKDIAQGEGDLTKRVEIQAQDEIGELAGWFNTFIEKLQGIIKKVAENSSSVDASATGLSAIANQMASGSDNSAMLANDASTSATEMSKNLDTIVSSIEESSTNASMVAAASEEMNATIGEIAKNAENGRSISDQAVSKAKDASSQMNELGDAAQSIGKVVETINVTQSSAVASEISDKMGVLNQSAGEMSASSSQVKMSAEELQQMAAVLNKIVGSFKV